jgi:hypothetical protein
MRFVVLYDPRSPVKYEMYIHHTCFIMSKRRLRELIFLLPALSCICIVKHDAIVTQVSQCLDEVGYI